MRYNHLGYGKPMSLFCPSTREFGLHFPLVPEAICCSQMVRWDVRRLIQLTWHLISSVDWGWFRFVVWMSLYHWFAGKFSAVPATMLRKWVLKLQIATSAAWLLWHLEVLTPLWTWDHCVCDFLLLQTFNHCLTCVSWVLFQLAWVADLINRMLYYFGIFLAIHGF